MCKNFTVYAMDVIFKLYKSSNWLNYNSQFKIENKISGVYESGSSDWWNTSKSINSPKLRKNTKRLFQRSLIPRVAFTFTQKTMINKVSYFSLPNHGVVSLAPLPWPFVAVTLLSRNWTDHFRSDSTLIVTSLRGHYVKLACAKSRARTVKQGWSFTNTFASYSEASNKNWFRQRIRSDRLKNSVAHPCCVY